MRDPGDAASVARPLLQPIGAGEQGYVFGAERWVVKVPRLSVLGVLARWVSRRRWLVEARGALGGLAAPFVLLDDVAFRAPRFGGRDARVVGYEARRAVARVRYRADSFLDHRLSLAEPSEALRLVRQMVELLERVRVRGFYMHDFIMKNFVEDGGRLLVADAGLVVPVRTMWEPAMRLCAWGFWRGLSRDYQRLLAEVAEEVGGGAAADRHLRDEVMEFREALPARLARLRRRDFPATGDALPRAVEFDPELEKEIRTVLRSVR